MEKKAPRGRPFEKGKSGNPTGRPKDSGDIKELAKQYTAEAIERLVFWMRSDESKASVPAANALLDRAWGKAAQAVTGDDGGPVKIIMIAGDDKL
jgi:hypothetical protein